MGERAVGMLNEVQASEYLGCSVRAMQSFRYNGRGPVYVKVGRAVRYRVSDLDDYIARRSVPPIVKD